MSARSEVSSFLPSFLDHQQVKELHLCTDERAIPVLERIVHSCNDILALRRYQRLSPLCVSKPFLPFQSFGERLKRSSGGNCGV